MSACESIWQPCPRCGGWGHLELTEGYECDCVECNATGWIDRHIWEYRAMMTADEIKMVQNFQDELAGLVSKYLTLGADPDDLRPLLEQAAASDLTLRRDELELEGEAITDAELADLLDKYRRDNPC